MENNPSSILNYYLRIPIKGRDQLGVLRSFSNLKVGSEDKYFWITGFIEEQISHRDIKAILGAKLFYEDGGRLFLLNSKLPERSIPSLFWTPIERVFPVTLPKLNYNYFGLEECLFVKLIPSEQEQEAYACICSLDILRKYIFSAPSDRLSKIQWAILENQFAILLGTPLLPIPGESFWKIGNFLIPSGYNFDLPLLADILATRINPNGYWIIWNTNNSYFELDPKQLNILSRAAFKLSDQ